MDGVCGFFGLIFGWFLRVSGDVLRIFLYSCLSDGFWGVLPGFVSGFWMILCGFVMIFDDFGLCFDGF